ncbi:recombination regulator RecX [Streptomyces tateyamensis]|uniref:Regulatory protein RecX n=1 Tax=Streptomyces tateyamensis TaxID=565073 RepID=A0A2V4MZT9_9ACTN|nr:recombination regulator RecX [Streptomyces tateyamensis]
MREPGAGERPDWVVEAKGEEEGERPDWVVDGPRAPERLVAPVAERPVRTDRPARADRPVRIELPARAARAERPARAVAADRLQAKPVDHPSAAPGGDWVAEAEAELAAAARPRRGRRSRSEPRPPGERRAPRAAEAEGDPAARARDICLRLLTGTPRTRKQLADALRKREIPEEVAEEVLSRFEEVGLIDDAAFAAAWVESRHHGRGLARRALAQELRTRGVSGALVEEAVAQLDPEDEAAAARTLVERKLRATAGLERQARLRRLVGMLARRGYAEGLAFRVVREALDAEGESAEELDAWALDEE